MPSNNIGRKRYIGIDGGGTKTVCIIGDEYGHILAVCRGEGSNVKSTHWPEVQRIVMDLIRETLAASASDVAQLDAVYLGLAGSDRPEDKLRWRKYMAAQLPDSVRLIVNNDAVIALAAGTWGQGGIVLIAGTGSIACGYLPQSGKVVRVGGWGYLLGDEGSGFDIGRKGLMAVMKQYDGTGENTLITRLVLESLQLPDPSQLIHYYYENDHVRATIADASRFVFQAARSGDSAALGIIDDAIRQLAELVKTAAVKLHVQSEVPLVLSGGLFSDRLFAERFAQLSGIRSGGYLLRPLLLPPVIGSYVLALAESGHGMTEAMKGSIIEHYKEQEELYHGAIQHW